MERRQITNNRGNYAVTALPLGEFTIKAELTNFKTIVREGIVLQVGDQARVDLTMDANYTWSKAMDNGSDPGAPITINIPSDNANIGLGPAQRPDLLRNPNLKSGASAERWFDTEAFRMPAPFTFGNAGRNVVYEASEANADFSLIKNTPINERTKLEFRAEIFNLLNHTNFVGAPGRIAFTPNFGRLFNAGPSRQMQLGMKVTF